MTKRARGNNQSSGAKAITITANAPSQQTVENQAENSKEKEFIIRNRNTMSLAQQNHASHDQTPPYNGDSNRDDSSRDS